ncbi:unnamed protein product [Chondrus crispus]|uniref:Uncharacterized protein n=1 Tax=Chondrus crispus TaxID=2769 RepID=R7QMF4_CHOCR|nr:unnamed protein product [Chondrus crispus]CDF38943.1 unnamed protein product [Chondrus crispus]|eukprot:XP_005718848.1 unnamed protein product [Chondrus crispus]
MHILIFLLLPVLCLAQSPATTANQRFDRLYGNHLVACVLLEDPYIIADQNRREQYRGIAIDYFRRLRDNLGFTAEFKEWNGNWSSFIETMSECEPNVPDSNKNKCPCTIGIGAFTMTNERTEKIQFVWPLGNEAHRMVGRKSDLSSDNSQNTWFVFNTFSLQVWIIIAVGMVMHALGSLAFGPFQPSERDLPRSTTHRRRRGIMWRIKKFPAAILFAYAHLLGHPFGEESQGTPSFHRTAWLMLGITAGLFLLTIYEASLTVLLFESTKESAFQRLEDIKSCALDPSRIAMIAGGASQAFWHSAVNTTEVRKDCPQWGKFSMTVEDLAEGFEAVKSNRADFFYSLEGSIVIRAQKNCDVFAPVGEPFFSTAVGFVMPKNIESLQRVLDELSRETRILREQDGFESVSVLADRSSCEDVIDARITPSKLWAFFVMYALCWGGLLLYRISRLYIMKRKEKDDGLRPTPNQGDIVLMDVHSMPTRGFEATTAKKHEDFDHIDEESSSMGYSIPDGYPTHGAHRKVSPPSSVLQTPIPSRNSSQLRQETLPHGQQDLSLRPDGGTGPNGLTSDGYPLETHHSTGPAGGSPDL